MKILAQKPQHKSTTKHYWPHVLEMAKILREWKKEAKTKKEMKRINTLILHISSFSKSFKTII